jgi:hypothetical protein
MLLPFVPKAREIDQNKDRRLSLLSITLAECVSIHSAATWLLDNREWDFFAVYYDAIDHYSHCFMKYHPPRQQHIPEADFELYRHVVSTAYQFHDRMLGTLLRKAGQDVTVLLISDHGFHPDHTRPKIVPQIPAGPAIEHRDSSRPTLKKTRAGPKPPPVATMCSTWPRPFLRNSPSMRTN